MILLIFADYSKYDSMLEPARRQELQGCTLVLPLLAWRRYA